VFRPAVIISIAAILITALPFTATALDDPTRPPIVHNTDIMVGTDEQPAMLWDLSSILIGPNRRLAVINGQTVTQGDYIGKAQVTAIKAGEVTLTISGEQTHIRLLPVLKKTLR
jgi:MSHA biogenesis protein MshK